MTGQQTLRIGLDFHETIVSVQQIKQEIARLLFQKEIPARILKREFTVPRLLSQEQYDQLLETLFEPKWFQRVKAVPGALETIQRLRNKGHHALIVTASDEKAFQAIIEWCSHEPVLDPGKFPVFHTGRSGSKRDLIRPLGLDAFLSDEPKELEALEDIVPHRFLLARKHNEHLPVPRGVVRTDWRTFRRRIDQLAAIRNAA